MSPLQMAFWDGFRADIVPNFKAEKSYSIATVDPDIFPK